MKKMMLSGILFTLIFANNTLAQTDNLLLAEYKKNKEKSDKDIANPKANIKAKTWLERAQAYENIAIYALSIDSTAAETALSSYKKAIELDTKGGKVGSVGKDAQTALTSKPLFNSFLQTGAGHYTKQNFKKALESFKLANSIDPKDSVATMYWGVAAQQLRDDANIIDAYEKHIALGGKDPIAFYAVFNAYRTAKNDDKAMAVLSDGIAKNPENKDLKAEKTNYYISTGKMDQAIASLTEMVDKDPENISNLLNLAILYDNASATTNAEIKKLNDQLSQGSDVQGKIDSKATQVQAYTDERNRLKDQLKKQPKNADVKRRLGEAETFLKEQVEVLNKLKAEKAEEDAKKVNVSEVKAKVDVLSKQRDADKANAIANYKKALTIDAKSFDANYNMGVISFNEGVELKRPYDNMNPTTAEFKANGKALEDKFIAKFTEALPFFELAYSVKKDEDVKESLKNIYRILKMEDKLKAMGE
jgi:hypothetical protein